MDFKPLINILADGQYHSGEFLGARLGITRAAVWKRLQYLAGIGLAVESIKGRGYRLVGGLQLLDPAAIQGGLLPTSGDLLNRLFCLDEVDSTNRFLLAEGQSGDVCLAERQTAGRGRRGRQWYSPYGSNLYLSVRWHFEQGVAALEGLSLAVGVLLAESLATLALESVELKWPNDLLCAGSKLGGVLIEVGGDLTGDCVVVIGIGLNVRMSEVLTLADRERISQPWTDLKQQGYIGDRNHLCSAILSTLLPALQNYPDDGFAAYKERWEQKSAYRQAPVTLTLPGSVRTGVLLGVDNHGGLRILTDAGEVVFSGGEISLQGPA